MSLDGVHVFCYCGASPSNNDIVNYPPPWVEGVPRANNPRGHHPCYDPPSAHHEAKARSHYCQSASTR